VAQLLHGLTVTSSSVAYNPNDGQSTTILLTTGAATISEDPAAILGHVDQNTFVKSEDFLMCPAVVTGITLEQQRANVLQYINREQDAGIQGGFIGPEIRRILAAMGYEIIPPTTRPTPTPANPVQFINIPL